MKDLSEETISIHGYRLKVIDTYAGFLGAEQAWKSLEERDPETSIFLSWDWLAQAFRENPYRWSVLAVLDPDDAGRFVGLLPLKYRVRWSETSKKFQTELEAGGRLLFSEYTGFLCDPTHEESVMRRLAESLIAMPWVKLSLRYVAQDRRSDLFCAAFERRGYPVTHKEYRINSGETDNLICPRVDLPNEFDSYLQTSVSSNTRQQYRRFQRQFFATGEYHFTHCDDHSFDSDIAILMDFWKQKWAPRKGNSTAKKVAENFEKVLTAALSTDALFLPVLWRGETPLGALGHVMDPRVGTMHFIIAGRDETAEEAFIGAALHFHSIECAIILGCEVYDFGHGDEPYKFGYGAQANKLKYFSVRRPNINAETMFDSISTGAALKQIEGFLKSGRTEEARLACSQLSGIFR